jgi:hypothetical protein
LSRRYLAARAIIDERAVSQAGGVAEKEEAVAEGAVDVRGAVQTAGRALAAVAGVSDGPLAKKGGLYLAQRVAAIAISQVAVIALFAVGQQAVPTDHRAVVVHCIKGEACLAGLAGR